MSNNDQNKNNSRSIAETLDISRRALSIARLVDRLPDGRFELRLTKRDSGWAVDVNRLVHISDAEFRHE